MASKNNFLFLLLFVNCSLLLICCQEKKNEEEVPLQHAIEIRFPGPVNDTTPFCKMFISDQKANKLLPDEKNLKFKPIELREIDFTDEFLRKEMSGSVGKNGSDTIFSLYGVNGENNKILCFDANNNGKFADDKIYKISNTMPFIEISNVKFSIDGKEKLRSVYLQPFLSKRISNSDISFEGYGLSFFYDAP